LANRERFLPRIYAENADENQKSKHKTAQAGTTSPADGWKRLAETFLFTIDHLSLSVCIRVNPRPEKLF